MISFRAMVDECPRMKALGDFLVASPHDFDRKWAAYVALAPDLAGSLNPKRGPAVVSPASSTTRSTTSLRVPRSAIPTANFHELAAATSSPTSALATSTASGGVDSSGTILNRFAVSTTPSAATSATTSKPIPTSAAPHDSSFSCDIDIVVASPTTRSTICLSGDSGAGSATSKPAEVRASSTVLVPLEMSVSIIGAAPMANLPTKCVVHEGEGDDLTDVASNTYSTVCPSGDKGITAACVVDLTMGPPTTYPLLSASITPTATLVRGVNSITLAYMARGEEMEISPCTMPARSPWPPSSPTMLVHAAPGRCSPRRLPQPLPLLTPRVAARLSALPWTSAAPVNYDIILHVSVGYNARAFLKQWLVSVPPRPPDPLNFSSDDSSHLGPLQDIMEACSRMETSLTVHVAEQMPNMMLALMELKPWPSWELCTWFLAQLKGNSISVAVLYLQPTRICCVLPPGKLPDSIQPLPWPGLLIFIVGLITQLQRTMELLQISVSWHSLSQVLQRSGHLSTLKSTTSVWSLQPWDSGIEIISHICIQDCHADGITLSEMLSNKVFPTDSGSTISPGYHVIDYSCQIGYKLACIPFMFGWLGAAYIFLNYSELMQWEIAWSSSSTPFKCWICYRGRLELSLFSPSATLQWIVSHAYIHMSCASSSSGLVIIVNGTMPYACELLQWEIAWLFRMGIVQSRFLLCSPGEIPLSDSEHVLFSLVCSAVCNKSHGLASPGPQMLNSFLYGSVYLQWTIAWLPGFPCCFHGHASQLGTSLWIVAMFREFSILLTPVMSSKLIGDEVVDMVFSVLLRHLSSSKFFLWKIAWPLDRECFDSCPALRPFFSEVAMRYTV